LVHRHDGCLADSVDYIHTDQLESQKSEEKTSELLSSDVDKLVPSDIDILRYNSDHMQKNQGVRHVLSGAKALYTILSSRSTEKDLDEQDRRQVEETLMRITSDEFEPDLAVYREALAFYVSPLKSPEQARTDFLSAVRKNLPLGFDFKELSEVKARREEWAKEDAEQAAVTNGASKE
jgi:hypothetical protein